ncbi:hypothetical protein LTR04_001596 [Oleoguttula sp. CCFEE 6159]|nr:hypothetical protein LTR04_001596 [Oleoguttula sp. CCFEE 6159]
MAKKRKAVSGQVSGESKAQADEVSSSKLRVNTYQDVLDSEDEFHVNRDRILLDEAPEAKRRRKWQEQAPSDEEVLAYSSASDDDGVEEDASDDAEVAKSSKTKARRASSSEASNAEEDDENTGGWGSSKRDYYNADVIETEQDALDEEDAAREIQRKQLQGMTEADFGFDETQWLDSGKADGQAEDGVEEGAVVTEILPQLQITEQMGTAERLKLLRTRYPEFELLSKEFQELHPLYHDLARAAAAAEDMVRLKSLTKKNKTDTSPDTKVPVAVIKHRALATYLAALTMYFALLTSTSDDSMSNGVAMNPTELRDHPIMGSMVKCRQLWLKAKDIRIGHVVSEPTIGNELAAIQEEPEEGALQKSLGTRAVATIDERPAMIDKRPASKPKKSKAKRAAERAAEVAQADAEARRVERMRKTEEELAALTSLTESHARQKTAKAKASKAVAPVLDAQDSDFGEETELTAQEIADKANRKKSLRFYTSQIAQKANKRGAAGRDAGGDADLPYKERLRDRQARLIAEAEKRGKRQGDARNELGGDSDDEDRRVAKELRGEAGAGSDDGYYDMVAARSAQRKSDKQALSAAHARASREGGVVVEKEQVGPDGHRAISYLIEKNKGLTPHRKKDVRNPRVKKKKAYEAKKKKLGSTRQVYKGGEGRGGYKGELTGIKSGLVKSVKL